MVEGHELKKITRSVCNPNIIGSTLARHGKTALFILFYSVLVLATPVFGGKCGKSLV